jgi:hypothetical protein
MPIRVGLAWDVPCKPWSVCFCGGHTYDVHVASRGANELALVMLSVSHELFNAFRLEAW